MSRGNKIRLSKSAIKNLEVRDKEYFQGDSEVPCFGVMVTPAGNKSFYLYGTVKGKKIKKKIGDVGGFGDIEDVRDVAKELYAEVIAPKKVVIGDHTVTELWEETLQHMHDKGNGKKHIDESEQRWNLYLKPKFGDRNVADVERIEFEDFMFTMRDVPRQANLVYALWRLMFNRAVKLRWVPFNQFINIDTKFPENPRLVAMEEHEIQKIWDATKDDDRYHLALRVLLLAGSRHKELFSSKMEWFELDDDDRMIWNKPETATKNKKKHKVYLSDAAQDTVIRAMKLAVDFEGNDEGWLFPSRDRQGNLIHITTVDHVWNTIRDGLGYKGKYRLYDLRKTFVTDLWEKGASDQEIIQLTSHQEAAVLHKHYAVKRMRHQKGTLEKLDQSFAK